MKKRPSDMTLKEFWRLFPIILKVHNPGYGRQASFIKLPVSAAYS